MKAQRKVSKKMAFALLKTAAIVQGVDPQRPGTRRIRKPKSCHSAFLIADVEGRGEGTGKSEAGNNTKVKMVTIASKSHFYNPLALMRKNLQEVLDPERAPKPVRSLKDMTPEEKAVLAQKYNATIQENPDDNT